MRNLFYLIPIVNEEEAAKAGKLKVYEGDEVVIPIERVEPTCISDIEHAALQAPIWNMKALLEIQVQKERFWEITEDVLLKIGTCIGELMLAKLQVLAG